MLWRGPLGQGAASGAMGAIVASHNSGGQYLRARTTPTNPASSFQTAVRNAVKTLTSRWQETLTAAQRLGWQVYADNVEVSNALGDAIHLSGIAMYVRSNVPRLQAGLTTIDAAPVQFDLGSASNVTLTLGAGTTAGTLTFDSANMFAGANNANTSLLLYSSRPQAQSINFFKGPFRLAGSVAGTNTTGTATITMPFNNGDTRNRTFYQIRVSRADGRLTSTFPGSGVPV